MGTLLLGREAVASEPAARGLAHAFRKAFRVGVAVSDQTIAQQPAAELALIRREFNTVTAENAMKWAEIRPDGRTWRWDQADRLMEFAERARMAVVGHTLVWHSQIPGAVFTDSRGAPLARSALLDRMQEHIDTLVGRYRRRIWAWDVVNEAIDEGNGWRRSPWFGIIGSDYMEQAFRFAHAADPGAQLLYNDYNMHLPAKRAFLVEVLRDYLDRGVPISGIGLQGHVGLTYPDLEEWERSIATYAAMGLQVHVTELDVDVLPRAATTQADIGNRADYSAATDPWRDGLPDEVQEALAARYTALFEILLRHRARVERVTFWGLHDGVSWKNDFPVRGRTNYPLLFDRRMRPKPAYHRLLALARQRIV